MAKPMGKVPSLGGKPSQQAMNSATGNGAMPFRPAGVTKAGIPKGKSVPMGKATKQPKGKAPPTLKNAGKGIMRKAVANVKGGSQTKK